MLEIQERSYRQPPGPRPRENIKGSRLYLRMSDEEKAKVVADAQAEGLSLSAYVRSKLGLLPTPVLELLETPVIEEADVAALDIVREWAEDEKRAGSNAPSFLSQDQRDGYDLAVSQVRLILRRFDIRVG